MTVDDTTRIWINSCIQICSKAVISQSMMIKGKYRVC